VPPLFALSIAIALCALARTALLQAVFGLALGAPLAMCLWQWSHAHAMAVEHINRTEVKMGLLAAQLPQEARLASFDIGGIGYFAHRPLVDLGGLVDPSTLAFVQEGRADELLWRERVTHVILPVGYGGTFPDPWNYGMLLLLFGNPEVGLRLVAQTVSPLEVWEPGLKATLHCAPRQMLFEVRRR
jgi:hypothetical protein